MPHKVQLREVAMVELRSSIHPEVPALENAANKRELEMLAAFRELPPDDQEDGLMLMRRLARVHARAKKDPEVKRQLDEVRDRAALMYAGGCND